ncbi:aminoglycoside phosphotransferase family protein [Puerhibacterium sp. TATVAM-FAB25]|uniref:aminoglycoside phosphotransferase family protein n=1 Tax=Puerhibacterium sp. TATVAM-FAB25 TaxID=3093699 RepID=UPI00397E46E9
MTTAGVRELLARHGYAARELRVLGAGLDHVAYEAVVPGAAGRAGPGDDVARLVVRVARDGGATARMRREVRLLRRLATVSPLPVPAPELLDDDGGACLVYPRLPGVPLLHAPGGSRRAGAVGRALGGMLRVLHAEPVERWADVVDADDAAPEVWRQDAEAAYALAARRVPREHRGPVEAFLATAAPAPATRRVLCHHDLGSEHVLVDDAGEVTGVLDWSDAALADPARDLGLVLRDLGRAGLRAALDAYGPVDHGARDPGLAARIGFYARCGALEDLAYGLTTGRQAYAAKSLASLGHLFGPEPAA